MDNFIEELDLPYEGKMINNQYIIDVNSSNNFSDLFNTISLNSHLSLEDKSVATVDEAKFIFTDGEYEVRLEADYNTDFYRLIVEER